MPTESPDNEAIHEPRRWRDNGWTAQVIKNNDDDGWAVAMYKAGEAEPALVGPWTMGRDKKNPKPLDQAAFNTLVKTAGEVLRRHEQQRHAELHKEFTLTGTDGSVVVMIDIVPDEEHPYALLSARGAWGDTIAEVRVPPGFKLTRASAAAWLEGGCQPPGRSDR
jgi:hypothetical protein